jgi:carbamate kinase
LAALIQQGYELVLTHGNGPQVGAIKLQNQIAAAEVPDMPLYVCGAESQGYLGFLFQQTLGNVLKEKGIEKPVVTVVTQTRVDADDPAFLKPSKPIGRFYTKEEAELLKSAGKTVVEDSGRGWRVTVASPTPREIVEGNSIRTLTSTGAVVISVGGGGIPVVRDTSGRLQGVEAVIDKDMSAALLARICDADMMVILTDVDGAYLNYRDTEHRQKLPKLTVPEAQELMEKGEFAAGSMGPKIKAAIEFAKSMGRPTVIASLDKLLDAVAGRAGTVILR